MAPPGAISTAVAVRKGPDACAFKIVCLDAHDTQGCRVACDDDAPAAADGHCDALLSMADTSAAQMKARMAESEVVLFSTRNDEGAPAAARGARGRQREREALELRHAADAAAAHAAAHEALGGAHRDGRQRALGGAQRGGEQQQQRRQRQQQPAHDSRPARPTLAFQPRG